MTRINQRLGLVLAACVLAIALACAVVLSADAAPTLTTEQRTALQLRVLIYRNAQLELEAVLKDLQVAGYTIDLSQLAYVKTPDPQGSK